MTKFATKPTKSTNAIDYNIEKQCFSFIMLSCGTVDILKIHGIIDDCEIR